MFLSRRAKNTGWIRDCFECDKKFKKVKIYTVKGDVPTKSDCSQSECRKACDSGGAIVNEFCGKLGPVGRVTCKGLMKVGGATCHDFCNSICRHP